MKKIFFIFSWLFLVIGVIFVSGASLAFYSLNRQTKNITAEAQVAIEPSPQVATSYSRPGKVKGVQTIIESADARPIIVAKFLERYKSPLKPYDHFGQVFVDLADKYQIDFRLLPAIAMQESNLCKVIPAGSYNCLGFGIHSRGTLTFESFEANFDRAAKELKANYLDRGLTTPDKIMSKYTPGSNGSWADSVNQWMREMEYNDRDMGKNLDTSENVLEYAQKKDT
jgi:hypothetical protein